ncbi:MAG: trypsin-like serine protease [Nannocystaceae bacterium]
MRAAQILVFASFASFALLSSVASADEPLAFSLDLTPQQIYGGTDVATCGWPTTVSLEGSCTATLVHPELVIFAAHCGSGYSQIRFGESINGGGGKTVQTDFCKTYPGGNPGNGKDFAFCKLAEPVTDVQIVPILMGCETDVLKAGTEVTIVGFGNADNGPYGVKREVTTTINSITGQGEASIGGNGKDSCQGDSGGPVYVKLTSDNFGDAADDTWRVFGITSYGGACGGGGYYSMMHNGIQWFEEESGIDLTPCHDSEGNWAPTGACTGFPLDPGAGGGTWPQGCDYSDVGGASTTCGAPAAPDEEPPTVTIVEPMDGAEYPGPSQELTFIIEAEDIGWGIKEVVLLINGEEVGSDSAAPYEFPATMPSGQWWIGAKAVDFADNLAYAEEIAIGVGMPAPVPDDSGTTGSDGETESGTGGSGSGTGGTDGGSDSDSDSGTSGASASGTSAGSSAGSGDGSDTSASTGGQDTIEIGCACAADMSGPGDRGLGLFGLLLAAGLLRRRR